MYSQALKDFILNVVLKGVLISTFGGVMRIPLVGNFIEWIADRLVGKLIDSGIVEFKEVMIDYLSDKAKKEYEPMIQVLRDAQYRDSMTPEEEAEYEKRLQNVVKNRPSIVNG